jgi:hypothetical protein
MITPGGSAELALAVTGKVSTKSRTKTNADSLLIMSAPPFIDKFIIAYGFGSVNTTRLLVLAIMEK